MMPSTRHEDWALRMFCKQMPPMKNDKLNRLEKIIKWFMGTIGTKKQNHEESGQRPAPQWRGPRPQWTPDGKLLCMECKAENKSKENISQQKRQDRWKPDRNIACLGYVEMGNIRSGCQNYQHRADAKTVAKQSRTKISETYRSGGSKMSMVQ